MKKGGQKKSVGEWFTVLNSRVARIEKYIFRSKVEQDVVRDGIAYLTVEIQTVKQMCGELDNKLDSFLVGFKRIEARQQ